MQATHDLNAYIAQFESGGTGMLSAPLLSGQAFNQSIVLNPVTTTTSNGTGGGGVLNASLSPYTVGHAIPCSIRS